MMRTSVVGQSLHIPDARAVSVSLPTPDVLLSRNKRRSVPQAEIGRLEIDDQIVGRLLDRQLFRLVGLKR